MIKLLHTADLHLDAPFPSLGEKEAQRRIDFLQTFERLLTLAIKWEADLFLVAGDLFDTPTPSAAVLGKVQSGLQRLAERGIVPVLLPGTHDSSAYSHSVFRRHRFPGCILLDGARVEEPVSLEIRGRKLFLYGFAYRGAESNPSLAGMKRRSADGIHIGLLHGSRIGSREWDYRPKDLPFSLDDLRAWGLDYVALGHYHDFEVLHDQGRLLACYPGSPEGKRFGENGPRYTALVTIRPEGVEVEKRVVNTRILQEEALDISGCADMDSVCRLLHPFRGDEVLLRLEATGLPEAPFDPELLAARAGGDFFHLEVRDRTRFFDSRYARRIASEQTVRGCFVRRVGTLLEGENGPERGLLEKVFREVLSRFQAHDGKAP